MLCLFKNGGFMSSFRHPSMSQSEVDTLENQQVLLGYFYMRLTETHGAYTPSLPELTSVGLRFLTKPTQVMDIYEKALLLMVGNS